MSIVLEAFVPVLPVLPGQSDSSVPQRCVRGRGRLQDVAAQYAESSRGWGPAVADLVAELAAVAAHATRRRVMIQDQSGRETVCADVDAMGSAAQVDEPEAFRTFVVTAQERPVGRLWFGPGPALRSAHAEFVRDLQVLLGRLLAS
jgi:hypothetical protein